MNQVFRVSMMLRKMAESISQKVGKPWYESTFNAIRTIEKHYPRLYEVGRIAAQRLGIREQPSTFGSDKDSFINIGSYLPRFLNGRLLVLHFAHSTKIEVLRTNGFESRPHPVVVLNDKHLLLIHCRETSNITNIEAVAITDKLQKNRT